MPFISKPFSHSSLDSSISSMDSLPFFADQTDYSEESSESSEFDEESTDFTPIAVASTASLAPPQTQFPTFADDTPLRKQSSPPRKSTSSSSFSNLFYSLAFCSATVAMYILGSQSGQVDTTHIKEAEAARDELIHNQERLLVQLAKDHRLPRENTDLAQHVALLQQELEQTTASLLAEEELRKETEEEAERAWEQYDEVTDDLADLGIQMKEDASKMYLTLAKERFGPGPHYAEFEVDIWEGAKVETRYFTVETTPLEHMPASVFLFLEQVDHGLWDGTSFHINAPHVLLAQPRTPHPVEEQPLTKMERMGLARVPFEEYNEDYTHAAYTLGYGGIKLPGPNFYINKLDNTDHHEGEPCFSKVIIGRDTIDRMGQLKGTTENPFYIQPVDIKKVRLVQDLNKVHGGADYLIRKSKNSHRDEH